MKTKVVVRVQFTFVYRKLFDDDYILIKRIRFLGTNERNNRFQERFTFYYYMAKYYVSVMLMQGFWVMWCL